MIPELGQVALLIALAVALILGTLPIIASHSSARAIADHPRNVPDAILKQIPANGGVIMVNFFSGFIVPPCSAACFSAAAASGGM